MYVDVQVADNFVSPLLDAVLLDYQRNVASAREPEVLSTMAVIVDKLDVSFFYFCLVHICVILWMAEMLRPFYCNSRICIF